MADHFGGFSEAAITMLAELNGASKEWFDEHKATYRTELADPAKAFVVDLGARLAVDISPGLVGLPRVGGSISPINNDLRFRPDSDPYKDHLLFRFWEGEEKKTAPTLFVRVSPDGVGFACGVAFSSVDRWREVVGGRKGAELAEAIDTLRAGREIEVAGQVLKRVPAPYPADHPRADLLRHKMFQVRWLDDVGPAIHSAQLVDECADRLIALAPLHALLVRYLR